MSRPILALLSDFGTRDHYVGAMKAAALSVCPDLTLVDITHDVTPHDVLEGALAARRELSRTFPAGTVFLVVVDPGVGSSRRGIAAECGDHRFVAPDNGVLTRGVSRSSRRSGWSSSPSAATSGPPSAGRSRGAIASRRRRPGC